MAKKKGEEKQGKKRRVHRGIYFGRKGAVKKSPISFTVDETATEVNMLKDAVHDSLDHKQRSHEWKESFINELNQKGLQTACNYSLHCHAYYVLLYINHSLVVLLL